MWQTLMYIRAWLHGGVVGAAAQSAKWCCHSKGDEFESEYCFYFHAVWINGSQTICLGFYIIGTLYSWLPRSEKHVVDTPKNIHSANSVALSGATQYNDDTQLQIFNELWGKIQHILRAVKAIVAAHKNSRGRLGDVDSMNAEWLGIIWPLRFTVWEKNCHFWNPDWLIQTKLNLFVAWWAIWTKFDFVCSCLLWSEHIRRKFGNFHLALPPIIGGPR